MGLLYPSNPTCVSYVGQTLLPKNPKIIAPVPQNHRILRNCRSHLPSLLHYPILHQFRNLPPPSHRLYPFPCKKKNMNPALLILFYFNFIFFCFQVSVFLIQGIDYVTFWSPAFLLYFIRCDMPNFDLIFEMEGLYLCLAFVGFQLLYCFTFLEDLNINIPPFTCSPMFVYVTKIF